MKYSRKKLPKTGQQQSFTEIQVNILSSSCSSLHLKVHILYETCKKTPASVHNQELKFILIAFGCCSPGLLYTFTFFCILSCLGDLIIQSMSGVLKCWFRKKTNLDCSLVVVVLRPFPPAQKDHWRLDHPFLRWKLVSSHKSKWITWRSRACRGWRWGLRGIEGLPRWPGSRSTGGSSLLLGAQGQAPEMSGGRVLLVVVGLLLLVQMVLVIMGMMPRPIKLASLMSRKILLTLALLANYADCAGTVVQV